MDEAVIAGGASIAVLSDIFIIDAERWMDVSETETWLVRQDRILTTV